MTREEIRMTHPVQDLATHPLPLHTSHEPGLAAQPGTSVLAQSAGLVYASARGPTPTVPRSFDAEGGLMSMLGHDEPT